MFIQDSTQQTAETPANTAETSIARQDETEQTAETSQSAQTTETVAPAPRRQKDISISYDAIVYIGEKPTRSFKTPVALETDSVKTVPYSQACELLHLQYKTTEKKEEENIIDESVYAQKDSIEISADDIEFVLNIPAPFLESPKAQTPAPLKASKPEFKYKDYKSFSNLAKAEVSSIIEEAAVSEPITIETANADSAELAFINKYKDSAISQQPSHIALKEPIDKTFTETRYKQVKAPFTTEELPEKDIFYATYKIDRPQVSDNFDLFASAKVVEKEIKAVDTDPRIKQGQLLLPVQKEEIFKTPFLCVSKEQNTKSIKDLSVIFKLPDTKKIKFTTKKRELLAKSETTQEEQSAPVKDPSHFFSEASWMLFFIFGSLAIWGYLRILFQKYLSATVRSALSITQTNRLARERNDLASRVSFFLKVIFHANFGLFIFQCFTIFKPELLPAEGITGAFIISGATAVIYIGKKILLHILGFVTKAVPITSEYNHATSTYNKFYGLLLFPIIFSIPYLTKTEFLNFNQLAYIGIIAFAFTYTARLLRGALITLQQNISPFYLILYLCMVEILPLLLLLKILIFK